MPSLAFMIAPAIGLVLLDRVGPSAAFAAAGLLGIAAALVIRLGPLHGIPETPAPSRGHSWRNLLERSATLPMSIEFLWVMTNVLFLIFPPVWAVARDIPVSDLTLYYPIVGGTVVVSRLVIGRRLDRWSRGAAIATGTVLGGSAVVIAAFADTVGLLTFAGALYAGSSSLVSPTASALAIDRSDPQRRGAAMATYSMGFPLGNGVGALLWGFVIAAAGFPVPFVLALLTMVAIGLLVWASRDDLFSRTARA